MYDIKVQLEDTKGELLKLNARLNKDYTNSLKSSSQSPNHKMIPNGCEKSGRKPGGQKGHIHYGRKQQDAIHYCNTAQEAGEADVKKAVKLKSRYDSINKRGGRNDIKGTGCVYDESWT